MYLLTHARIKDNPCLNWAPVELQLIKKGCCIVSPECIVSPDIKKYWIPTGLGAQSIMDKWSRLRDFIKDNVIHSFGHISPYWQFVNAGQMRHCKWVLSCYTLEHCVSHVQGFCHVGHPSEIHLKSKSHKLSFRYNALHNYLIILKFCTARQYYMKFKFNSLRPSDAFMSL